jgi:hypothetical protein
VIFGHLQSKLGAANNKGHAAKTMRRTIKIIYKRLLELMYMHESKIRVKIL